MKRVLGVLFVLAAVAALSLAANRPASAAGMKTLPGVWSTGLDTTFVTDFSDSDFVTFDVSDAEWPGPPSGSGTAFAPYNFAVVTVTANVTNAASDSLYFVVQRGTSYYNHASGATVTSWENWPAGPTAAAGNSVIVDQGFGGTSNVRWVGNLLADPDGAPSAINVYGAKLFRLRFQGDKGTTPKASGVRVSIRYLSRNPN